MGVVDLSGYCNILNADNGGVRQTRAFTMEANKVLDPIEQVQEF